MASQTITNTTMTHKDKKPRRKLVRTRLYQSRFVSRDASEMSRKLREMMEEAPDEATRREIQRLADKMESM